MKVLNDYSFIRGVCNTPKGKDPEQIERELNYAKRLGINSTRYWIRQGDWETDPEGCIKELGYYISLSWKLGITTMPVLCSGNGIKVFTDPTEKEWEATETYVAAIINAFKDDEGLLMWDVMNEPMCNPYIRRASPEDKPARIEQLKRYVRRLCGIARKYDQVNAITVGHELISHVESTADLVDILSFHDYSATREEIENVYIEAERLSEKYGKPLLNTETGCICRSNPYDVELEICEKHKVGWYLFNLVIEGFWGSVHGIVYPDGTIRDPGIVAAMFGFYRNRTPGRVLAEPNREAHAGIAVKAVEDILRVEIPIMFLGKKKTTSEILNAAEYCVNLLEAGQMVAMWNPPSARIADWRAQSEEERDVHAIRAFAYEMAMLLKKNCSIF